MNNDELKTCAICGKQVKSLASHVNMLHPDILKRLSDEQNDAFFNKTQPQQSIISPKSQRGIRDVIAEYVDTLLQLKLVEYLSSPQNKATFKDLQSLMNPQKDTDEIDKAKKLIEWVNEQKGENKDGDNIIENLDTGDDAVLSLVKELLPLLKKDNKEVNQNVRQRDTGSAGRDSLDKTGVINNEPKPIFDTQQHNEIKRID